jgi:hypothetical protein
MGQSSPISFCLGASSCSPRWSHVLAACTFALLKHTRGCYVKQSDTGYSYASLTHFLKITISFDAFTKSIESSAGFASVSAAWGTIVLHPPLASSSYSTPSFV